MNASGSGEEVVRGIEEAFSTVLEGFGDQAVDRLPPLVLVANLVGVLVYAEAFLGVGEGEGGRVLKRMPTH